MNKKFRTITGSLMAAAMLASSAAGFAAPVTANAGQLLGQTDFEDGIGLPWHTCSSAPASQHFEITDSGEYVVYIDNPDGADGRWDLQFRHKGLQIVNGHNYTLHAEITASDDGYIYSAIGNYSGDTEYWHDLGDGEWRPHHFEAGETLVIDTSFRVTNAEEGPAEWRFQYANNNGRYNNFDTGMPAGSTIIFDNLSLIDEDGGESPYSMNEYGVIRPQSNVRLNQVGYFERLAKKASYVTDASEPLTFHIYNAFDEEVYTNTACEVIDGDFDSGTPEDTRTQLDKGVGTKYKDSGKYVQILDFSDFTTGGDDYYIVVDDKVGVSGTRCGKKEGAYDTTVKDGKVMWTNPKTYVSYQMNKSHPFKIANTVYDGLLRDSLNYFYQNRSGCKVEPQYVSSGDRESLAHALYGHNPDIAYVQPEWVKYYADQFDGSKKYSVTATGGWYDSGDHCKSVINGGNAVWTLQNMYEMSKKLGRDSKWTDGKTVLVPEGKDSIPDVLDEARYELDWMFDMIVSPDDPYFGDDAGLVYHKLQDHRWTGLAIHAWIYEGYGLDTNARIIKPPTYAATFNMIACAAQASRLWKDFDPEYAEKCLKNAEASLAAVEKYKDRWNIPEGDPETVSYVGSQEKSGKDTYFAPADQAIGGAAYGDTFVCDDYYWALCELYATTGKKEYYEKLKGYKNPNDATGMDKAFSLTNNIAGGENRGSFSSFNWGCTSGYGTLSLYLNSEGYLSDADHKTVQDAILKAADIYIEEENKQGMGIPYHGYTYDDPIGIGPGIRVDGYENGSNSFVVNNAIVMAYAYEASRSVKYIDGVSTAMDYIFGRNGNDFSYVSGYGDRALEYPHHRLWANGVDPSFPKAPAGVLAGGPAAGLYDDYVAGLGFRRGTLASQKCYVDSAEAWSVNDVALQWNAPLAWVASYLDDTFNRKPDIEPLTVEPTTAEPTTVEPTTAEPATTEPTTVKPTAAETTTGKPAPTESATVKPTAPSATTPEPATAEKTTAGSANPVVLLWGDANMDNKVTVADSVAVLQYICNQTKYALTDQGKLVADVVDNGKGITGEDAIAIQKIDAGLIDQSDCPVSSSRLKDFK